MTKPIVVAVTGAAGNIGYSLLFRLASGETFGDRPVILKLLDLPIAEAQKKLEGTAMEVLDCGFKTLVGVQCSGDANVAFDGASWVLLVGSKPRGPGMARADLIRENGPIFVGQGNALQRGASDMRVLVVGNPCNTNCLIAASNCAGVPKERFSAMTRLDENRAIAQLAGKAGCTNAEIAGLTVFGNHSESMYPDFENATIRGQPATNVIGDLNWLQTTFVANVQNRGKAIIAARGLSSAASAASAAIDHVKDFERATPAGQWFSAAVWSEGSYASPAGIYTSLPVSSDGKGGYSVVQGLQLSPWAQDKVAATNKELLDERAVVADLLKG
ncbi:MAG: malate dehydrogenase [Myxococcales bacterium]|nr:malate dehydrogenase [Myxococcales bacterium]